uniref:Anaphase-promoting complex subunit 4 WD40 domain-containing protein n=1 Tax=Capra hircus TaxID=9925 RepID=A0A452E1E9_CAPHI
MAAGLFEFCYLGTPIPNAPASAPRAGRANRSHSAHSAGRTPGRTPGKSSSKLQSTPSKPGGDRYIPHHSASQMEVTPTKKEHQKAWALNLNGFDMEEAKILRLSGKPQNAPEGYQNRLKVLYSQKATPGSSRKTCRYIPSLPDRILDAPEIRNDYYLNLVDWSPGNVLAVALDNSVSLWSARTGDILHLLQMEQPGDYISSVGRIKEGNCLAVAPQQKRPRNMTSHSARVGSLCWNGCILSRAEHHVATVRGHGLCGLCWALDGRHLASGGNDSLVSVWPSAPGEGGWVLLQTFTQHQGASNVLATGGGTSDGHIRIWSVRSGVCSILWSPHYKELISGHSFAQNQLVIWKYPTMAKVAELKGHTARVLLTMSPDGATVASAAADETLRLWRCFELDPARQQEREASVAKSSLIHQGIR